MCQCPISTLKVGVNNCAHPGSLLIIWVTRCQGWKKIHLFVVFTITLCFPPWKTPDLTWLLQAAVISAWIGLSLSAVLNNKQDVDLQSYNETVGSLLVSSPDVPAKLVAIRVTRYKISKVNKCVHRNPSFYLFQLSGIVPSCYLTTPRVSVPDLHPQCWGQQLCTSQTDFCEYMYLKEMRHVLWTFWSILLV